jgi:hypothetical protein
MLRDFVREINAPIRIIITNMRQAEGAAIFEKENARFDQKAGVLVADSSVGRVS